MNTAATTAELHRKRNKFLQTQRKDNWWVAPLLTFLGFSAFIIYSTWAALQGAHYTWGPTGLEHTLDATAGDFVYIPAGEVHVEANASADAPLVVLLTRNCPDSHVVYMDDGPDGIGDVPAPC